MKLLQIKPDCFININKIEYVYHEKLSEMWYITTTSGRTYTIDQRFEDDVLIHLNDCDIVLI